MGQSGKRIGIKENGDETMRSQTTIRLPAELMEQLRREAQEKGYTVSDLIVFILWDYFRKPTVQE